MQPRSRSQLASKQSRRSSHLRRDQLPPASHTTLSNPSQYRSPTVHRVDVSPSPVPASSSSSGSSSASPASARRVCVRSDRPPAASSPTSRSSSIVCTSPPSKATWASSPYGGSARVCPGSGGIDAPTSTPTDELSGAGPTGAWKPASRDTARSVVADATGPDAFPLLAGTGDRSERSPLGFGCHGPMGRSSVGSEATNAHPARSPLHSHPTAADRRRRPMCAWHPADTMGLGLGGRMGTCQSNTNRRSIPNESCAERRDVPDKSSSRKGHTPVPRRGKAAPGPPFRRVAPLRSASGCTPQRRAPRWAGGQGPTFGRADRPCARVATRSQPRRSAHRIAAGSACSPR